MGMIRVSDHAEKIIKEQANGRTISATVDALLAGGGESSSVLSKLDYLENYLNKRLSKLESLLEDTAVDRLDSGGPRKSKSSDKEYLDWSLVQDIFYDLCWADDSPEWVSKKMHDDISELNESLTCFVQDGIIYSEDIYGHAYPIMKLSQRVQKFIDERKAA